MLTRQLIRNQVRYFSSTKYKFNNNNNNNNNNSNNEKHTIPSPLISNRTLTEQEKKQLEPMIRVDQSGEVGAYYIYKGQMAVLGRDKNLRPLLQEMWDKKRNTWNYSVI
ncbi:unnamed protein product [Cunninghamella echinulata]